jgi:hypothetical protein
VYFVALVPIYVICVQIWDWPQVMLHGHRRHDVRHRYRSAEQHRFLLEYKKRPFYLEGNDNEDNLPVKSAHSLYFDQLVQAQTTKRRATRRQSAR